MSSRVLVVDDDPALAEMLGIVLRGEGFEPAFVADGDAALGAFRRERPDLVLLDLMLPGTDGIEVCRQIRAESVVPIVMLTARSDTVDVVLGLEVGADDYVSKPYRMRELVARMRATLRRAPQPAPFSADAVVEVGHVRLDAERHEVFVRNKPVKLPLKEFELLEALLHNAGKVLTRDTLIDRVWGSAYAGDTKTLDVHIKRLRAKIETEPGAPQSIVTIRGLGYKFELPARAAAATG